MRLLFTRRRAVACSVGLAVAAGASGALSPSAVSAPPTRTLSIALAGTGSGTVTSSPAGINCGTTCSANFKRRTLVTLTATPTSGSTFAGWNGGGCSGTGTCVIRLLSSTSVTATFTQITYALNVSISPAGAGQITGTGGIDCPTTCSTTLAAGSSASLNVQQASSGYVFWHWTGDCTGSGCQLTMNSAKSVQAVFAEGWALCSGAPQTKHSNGLGQYFFDCDPPGVPGDATTYSASMAQAAANAWNSSATRTDVACSSGRIVVATTATSAASWGYSGTIAGRVFLNSASTTTLCPLATDGTWG